MIGTTIENRFLIHSLIGEGGMAEVYRASHQAVDLNVAVKVLKKDANFSESDIERFKREARALNSLFHPNIVKVYSFGFLETGQAYLVLDLLEGKSLEEIILGKEEYSLSWSMEVFLQICKGLSCAHEQSIIHRDLKPSNIMIVDSEEDGSFVKLLDFGIAKSSAPKDGEQRLTRKGAIFGSPLYMSPEQISGKELSLASDIYSLGCLMYESLTGSPPFQGDTMIITFVKHMQEQAEPFSAHGLADYPKELEELVFQCMEKEPAKRMQTAGEVVLALEKILAKNSGAKL